ncbi:Cys-tRNA(Pro) deacylase [Thalassotalea euphylliae]|uniref:Cys-tRNA(Pro)/Cys-tRNA(Cys) deacylase n=1 Tax=Thalassotalea euphylliae TaxID=1655234 RepID=A0A3E0TLK0_9GAMM|nr:Cys-tRNA(Pro) deacylase [Thalassotalea euphylliae]REL25421.1 Cys-tRNA(Pro) deacylase [Thalassotalea euphylliae]
MTPAVTFAKRQKLAFELLEYQHDSNAASYGMEAVEKLALPAASVFKTLVVETEQGQLIVAIIPVAEKLSLKLIAKAAKAKKAVMANPDKVQRSTGYVLGGVSPLGQKKRLPTFIDASAEQQAKIYVSAGRRGLEIGLAPQDLRHALNGEFSELSA